MELERGGEDGLDMREGGCVRKRLLGIVLSGRTPERHGDVSWVQ